MKKALAFAVFTFGLLAAADTSFSQERPRLPNFDRRMERPAPPPPPGDPAGTPREQAERVLKARVRAVRIDADPVTHSPKWVGSTEHFLTGPNGNGGGAAALPVNEPHRAVKLFLNEHRALFGHDAKALAGAQLQREDASPASGLRTVVWQQMLDGIPVFEGILKAGIGAGGELVNIGSQFVAVPEAAADAGTPDRAIAQLAPRIGAAQAVALAGRNVGAEVAEENVQSVGEPEGPALRQHFSAQGLLEPRVTLVWLPMGAAELRLCWSVIFSSKARGEMFRVVVDADSGEVQLRHGLTEYISDASYRVFTGDSPTPLSPGHATPLTTQPPLATRALVTTPALNVTASPNGWIDDGVNETRGNNVDAHLDLNQDNVADLPRPQGAAGRVFDFPLDLTLAPSAYRDAAVTDLFYWCNLIHDRFYELGFTEAAGNFQNNTFGRGGLGNDAVQADAQDGSGTNNANFSTPPDGAAGRMQMFVFTGPTPDRDGDFDHEIVIHEYTHGLSNRLVGGGTGISALQTRGMGEGWSDFYALCLLAEAGDNVDGVYASGAYASHLLSATYTQNYYFGIRRYPYTTDLLKNPLTFKDIDPTRASPHTGIPISPLFGGSDPAEVHNQGEVWCNTLWEMRANLVRKLGFQAGNTLALRLVTDGMKLSPANPNFLQARDAIVQAELVLTSGANRGELWAAFAKRGMGANATSPASSTTTGVVENYDLPDTLSVSPAAGFTSRGDAGGPFTVSSTAFTLRNNGTAPLNWTASTGAAWLTLSGAGGTLAASATATLTASLNAAANALANGLYTGTVTVVNTTSGIVQTRTFTLRVGVIDYFTEVFDTSANDTAFQSFTFTPNGSASFYRASRTTAAAFPTSPTGGVALPLGDDTFNTITLTGGATVPFYGASYGTIYVGSNGYVTFGAGDSSLSSTLSAHFAFKRIAALMEDLLPNTTAVTWRQLADRVAVTFQNVPEYSIANSNSFQIEMFFDGRVRITILAIGATGGLIGLSNGAGVPADFTESDFSAFGPDAFLTLTAPAQATEGAGVLANAGRVTATPAPAANLTVTLSSNRPADVAAPATVTILAGQSAASFPITIVDDTRLDGTVATTITAQVPNWTSGSATISVADNDTASLTILAPATVREGDTGITGTVRLGGSIATPLTVALSADDPTEITVPATVTIPAGQTTATFPITVVNDPDADGAQTVMLTAFANGFSWALAVVSVADNDAQHFTIAPIAGPVLRSAAVPVSISARDVNGAIITNYNQTVAFTTNPASVPVTPANAGGFVNGVLAANLTFTAYGNGVVLTVADAGGHTGASNPFDVISGPVARFVWSTVASPQFVDAPFAVTIRATDAAGNTVPAFTGTASLSALAGGGTLPVNPASTGAFTAGEWSGNAGVPFTDASVVLHAVAGALAGDSNAFAVSIALPPGTSATVLAEDFESGILNPSYWTITGTGTFRTINTNLNTPHGGLRHMTMDSSVDESYSRNEATLTVNLAGRTAVQLKFWSRSYADEPNGPPLAPFPSTGADFDGVAISADGGANWYEVQALRTLTDVYAQFTVDLDAALAARGLAYGSNFKIRFNQYDNYAIATDGIGIDDILITAAAPPSTLTLSLPAQATEGAGVIGGSVSVPTAPAANLVLTLSSKSPAKVTVPPTVTILAGQTSATFPLTVLDDPFLDGTKTVVITAVGAGYLESGATMQIIDNDGGALTLSLPATVPENAGTLAGTLTLSLPPLVPFTVVLASNNAQAAQPPATVAIARGATTANFDVTIPDDTLIDGNQNVRITASAAGWTGATADFVVVDNEARVLTVTIPASFREGDAAKTGTVSIGGTLATNLTVALASSDTTEIAVPVSVTIPAGQTQAAFTITVVDDTIADGAQPFTITASAATFASTTASGQVRDNEAHHFSFAPIASPQAGGGPVPAIVTARDPNDAVLTDFNSTIAFTATGSGGALAVTPVNGAAFINGVSVNSVQLAGLAANVVLTATAASGATGSSNAFDLVAGAVSRFVWDAIPSPQTLDTPFDVTVRAVDAGGATVPAYHGIASLTVGAPSETATIGTGASPTYRAIYTASHDSRSETIYTAAEVGGAARLTALALNFTTVAAAGEPLTNLTIRLKHTALATLAAGSAWDNTGWTQVYRASPVISATGWVTFAFTTPFDFNGTNNLLVDLSIDRTATTSVLTYVQGSTTATAMSVYGSSASTNGDPLAWSGTVPFTNGLTQRADLRFTTIKDLPIRPPLSGAFANGVWTGSVSVPISGSALTLKAQAGTVGGLSNSFAVNTPPVIPVNPAAGFTFTIPAEVSESADGVDGGVTLTAVSAANTVIALTSSAPAKITVPASVTVPAGQTGATFAITVIDDAIADGNRAVAIAGTIAGLPPRPATITVLDNDALPFSLAAPATVAEGAAVQTGTITLGAVASGVVTVNLASSDTTAVQVPASVTLQPGQQTATFPITVVNDTIIDGTQIATLTASVPGWTDATATIAVTDNETRALSLSAPVSVNEGGTATGTVSTSGTLAVPLTVTLTSANTAQLTVPASVTIAAGATSASFVATGVDDTLLDGTQTVTLTAAAATFTGATGSTLVYDNDVHHFTFATTIATPQIANRAFATSIEARDLNNVRITTYAGVLNLTASGAGGALTVAPAAVTLAAGVWSGNLAIATPGTGVTITARAGTITGVSNSFEVGIGALDHLSWNTVASPQAAGVPFTATLLAKDAYENTVTTANGAASVSAGPPSGVTGTGTAEAFTLFESSAQERNQLIYQRAEVGSAGRINSLAMQLNVLTGGTIFTTVRMKHTTLASYATAAWESTGWTVVYQGNLTFTAGTGAAWMTVPLTTPFQFDGASNLMVDISHSVGAIHVHSITTTATATRTLYFSGSGFADPLTWTGTANPAPSSTTGLLNLRLGFEGTVPVAPASVTLANGVWTGALAVQQAASGIVLKARTAAGIVGDSNAFNVTTPPIPTLAVSPADGLTAAGSRGGPFTPATKDFTLSNPGVGTVAWTASKTAAWLNLSSTAGTLAAGASTTVTASLNAAANALAAGNFTGTLTFTNTTNGSGSTTRPLALTVAPVGELTVTPATNLDASGPVGGPFTPASRAYTLTNSGDAALSWTAAKTAPWLTLSSASGTLAPAASTTVTATIAATALEAGSYSDSVIFTNTTSGRGNTSRAATLSVILPAPVLFAEPPFTGGTGNSVAWSAVAAASDYEAQAAGDEAFTSPVSSGWIAGTSHPFAGLTDGTRYSYRARARRSVAEQSGAWTQTTQAEFDTDTKTAVVSNAPGHVTLASGSGTPVARILNPSFETGTTTTNDPVPDWTKTSSGLMGGNPFGGSFPPMPTAGLQSALLFSYHNQAHVVGDYQSLGQAVDLTGIATLVFDANLLPSTAPWLNALRAEVLIDGVMMWSATAQGSYLNQTIDTTAFTGIHTIELVIRVILAGTYTSQWTMWDNLRTNAVNGYMAGGTLTSTLIAPVPRQRWGALAFTKDTSAAGTALTVDVLDASGALLAANVAAGTDLSGIAAVAAQPSIRLRANLSTSNSANTPRLDDWSVSYVTVSAQSAISAWSNVVASTQDATAPALAITSPIAASTVLQTIAGTASDASGISSIMVNGVAAVSGDAFAHWSLPVTLAAGANTLSIVARDSAIPANTTTVTHTITVTPAAGDADADGLPDAWEALYGLSTTDANGANGALGDPDGDGRITLLELALGANPVLPDTGGGTPPALMTDASDGKTYLTWQYRRLLAPGALSYLVETSADLTQPWHSGAGWIEEVGTPAPNPDGLTETVTVRALPPIGPGASAGHLRLRIALP